jgi:hypothetical protein
MRPVAFGEALPAGTRLTLFSDDKPDPFFTVIKFWMDETMGASPGHETGVPSYQVEGEEGRTHLLIHLPIRKKGKTDGVSAGPTKQALTPGRSLRVPGSGIDRHPENALKSDQIAFEKVPAILTPGKNRDFLRQNGYWISSPRSAARCRTCFVGKRSRSKGRMSMA